MVSGVQSASSDRQWGVRECSLRPATRDEGDSRGQVRQELQRGLPARGLRPLLAQEVQPHPPVRRLLLEPGKRPVRSSHRVPRR